MSKLPFLMFLLTGILAGLLLYCLLRPAPIAAAGAPHPEVSEMNRGGDASRDAGRIVIGGLYGGLQIVLLVTGLCLGIRRDLGSPVPLLIAGAAYLVTFAAMVGTYALGMENVPIVLGLPLPTSLMVFGMWGVPFLFVVLYVAKFRDWIFSDEDSRRFANLVAQSQPHDTSDSGR